MEDLAGLLHPAKAPIISCPIWRQIAGQVADGTLLDEEDGPVSDVDGVGYGLGASVAARLSSLTSGVPRLNPIAVTRGTSSRL